MSPPRVRFDNEELTMTLTGTGAGWSLGQLGQLRLFDQARVQFPSSWSQFKIQVSTEVLQTHWQLRSTTLLRHTLESGITYSLANGTSAQMSANTELIEHLLHRPLVSVDLFLNVRLDGEANRDGFRGKGTFMLGFRGRF